MNNQLISDRDKEIESLKSVNKNLGKEVDYQKEKVEKLGRATFSKWNILCSILLIY